jgi:hypothetical protein
MSYIRRNVRFRRAPKNPIAKMIKEKHSQSKKQKQQNDEQKPSSK